MGAVVVEIKVPIFDSVVGLRNIFYHCH